MARRKKGTRKKLEELKESLDQQAEAKGYKTRSPDIVNKGLQGLLESYPLEPQPAYDWKTFQTSVSTTAESAEKMAKKLNEFASQVTISSDDFSQWNNTLTQYGWEGMKELRKVITDINIDVETQWVDVQSLDSPIPTKVKGATTIKVTDQDGDRLPPGLEAKVVDAYKNQALTAEAVKQLLDEHNQLGEDVSRPSGHKAKCLYMGTHHYPCSCQPETIWGKTNLYHCPCCEEPRAQVHHGLCELCESHQDATTRHTEIAHEVRAMNE